MAGDQTYTVQITDEVRELIVSTCGSDTTFKVYSAPSVQVTFPTTPCSGQQGNQGFALLSTVSQRPVIVM